MGVWSPGPAETVGDDTFAGDSTGETVSGLAGSDSLAGADGDDQLSGGADADVLDGGAGHDHLAGDDGDDSLSGGGGWDWLDGGAGADRLDGGAGYDAVTYRAASAGVVVSLALATAQDVGGGMGLDTLVSIEGLWGSDFGDTLSGDAGRNALSGGLGDDQLAGGDESDALFGGDGADTLAGDAGDDALFGDAGDDRLVGGIGFDWAVFTDAGGVSVDLGAAQAVGATSGSDGLFEIEGVWGSTLSDTLIGDGGANVLVGDAGDDVLAGAGDDDWLFGGAGNDALDGGDGDDALFGGAGADHHAGGLGFDEARYDDAGFGGLTASLADPARNTGAAAGDTYDSIEGLVLSPGSDRGYGDAGANRILGRGGHDHLYGGGGADTLDGGWGFDYARYDDAAYAGFTASLADPTRNTGAAAGDVFVAIEGLVLGSGNDWGYGDGADNYLYGMGGHDNLIGGAGADHLHGGAGFDYVRYDDAAYPGFTASLADPTRNTGAAAGDRYAEIEGLILGSGNDFGYGDAGANYLYGMGGHDNLIGGAGADYLHGGAGFDYARYDDQAYAGFTASLGSPGANTGAAAGDRYAEIEGLVLGSGNDSGVGDAADNYLYGMAGDDTLDGGGGADHLHGGAGADRFVISSASHSRASGPDRVLDFDPGQGDVIDVSALDADPGQSGDQAFAFVASFTNTVGQVRAVVDAARNETRLEFDLNGDGVGQEMLILLTGQFPSASGLAL
ncbi:calcium-binding protein [Phenylobacterium terrae]|uniref:Calcium-binding protein n=1 Tax=Phenylobacterium terrae TaxID=2665495 RepID=A0ABW4N4J6_9CAUL